MVVRYDPLSAAFRDDREGVYRRLRDEAPVYLEPDGRFAALSRFDDVRAAANDWATYSAVTAEAKILRPIINDLDPPRHGERRGLLARAFTPRRVAELEPRVRAVARALAADIAPRGSCDVVADFAAVFPSLVIAALMGISDELLPECRAISDSVMRIRGPEDNASPVELADALFRPLIAARRADPQDDLISALLASAHGDADDPLSEEEILGFCYLLLIGGSDTTTNLIGNGMELLARHHDQRAALVADHALLGGAIEEMLRREPPTQHSARQTTRDVELHDTVIPGDTRVLLVWGAANLDPDAFPDPERFDITRPVERHLALGHGAHFCMGAALARLELRIAFEELLAVMPEFEVHGPLERIPSVWAWGFERLRVTFEPAEVGAS
jgi:hypothetical protein